MSARLEVTSNRAAAWLMNHTAYNSEDSGWLVRIKYRNNWDNWEDDQKWLGLLSNADYICPFGDYRDPDTDELTGESWALTPRGARWLVNFQ